MKTMKKFFASLLVLCMVLAMPNINALAADELGTQANPEVITSWDETAKSAVQVAGQEGYWYKYVAPSTGVLSVSTTATTSEATYASFRVLNNTTGLEYTNEDAYAFTGDELLICVRSQGMDWETYEPIWDDATITWNAEYSASNVSESNPISFWTGEQTTTLYSTTEGVGFNVYSTYADVKGTYSAYVIYTYDNPMTEDVDERAAQKEELKAEIVLKNVTQNTTAKLSESTLTKTDREVVYEIVQLNVNPGDEIIVEVTSGATGLGVVSIDWTSENLGEKGSMDNPYAIESEEFEVTIPAQKTEYYISFPLDYDGYAITLEGEGSYTLYKINGDTFASENGVVETILNVLYGRTFFYVDNPGESDLTLKGTLVAPVGSETNPDEIVAEEGKNEGTATHEFVYNSGEYSYFYKWVATEDGYVRLTVSAEEEERSYEGDYNWDLEEFEVINVTGEVWFYSAYNVTAEGETIRSFSKENDGEKVINGALIEVSKGDVVLIEIQALDATTGYWADSTITVDIEGVDFATGSEESAIKDIENHLPDTDDEGNPVEVPATVILLDKDGNISGVITKEVLEAAKENGVDIAFGVAENVVWVIDADSLGDTLTDLDLSVGGEVAIPEELVTALVGENDGYTVSIAHDGALGLDAMLGLILGDENCDYTGMYANLFWYNETTGGLEFQDAYEMEDGHTAVFEMTHASDYVIVMSEEAMSAEDNIVPETSGDDDTIEGTGDFSSTMIYVIVLLGAALVSAGFVAKKRFA